ncbi:hypothetical protein CFP56_031417 [Quercus suber]|uniref:Uncharacterized protein n=1 Tax=Quercus suber TaxID=58331 RepID=A0AAW0JJ47_QUESU
MDESSKKRLLLNKFFGYCPPKVWNNRYHQSHNPAHFHVNKNHSGYESYAYTHDPYALVLRGWNRGSSSCLLILGVGLKIPFRKWVVGALRGPGMVDYESLGTCATAPQWVNKHLPRHLIVFIRL